MTAILAPVLAAAIMAAPQLRDRLANADVSVPTGDGSATYELLIAPDGWVDDCTVVRSDYGALQDDRVCVQLMREKAREPARGANGKPVHAAVKVTRNRGEAAETDLPADLVLEVAAVPGSAANRRSVALNVMIDDTGRMSACEAAHADEEAFASAACGEAKAIAFRPRKDRDGRAVPYLTSLMVDFVVSGSAG
ncbi:hypothetical protein FHS61_002285 [Altererythrobacter atlanticus]|uniref:Gram-negative bacterial tonB protein n=1 Tax=Croceibacterium atlanticum TaxID=1267766 RepID=A0A0F7KQF1_9SPHN|nr:hypothetical protein [Croceibacterium atlanticum]AKH41794.1 Gram-negative bacterial tonB protein [Croceibacterium atlanticum]MBB5733259.1 hypothetical protein [Croceibacterium atlanticum]